MKKQKEEKMWLSQKNASIPIKVIKKREISLRDEPVLIKPDKMESTARVNLHKEEGIVRIIEVICPCGNRINIACEYENEKVINNS